jgi:molybdopterin-guanine dinucleotide biosynthesis protein A
MGQDKGSLIYGTTATPQVRKAWETLVQVCGEARVSINAEQAQNPVYSQLPVIIDDRPDEGPAGGLLSAFESSSDTAWLILAVDMPRVSVALLRNLIVQRDSSRIATVHCHADGTIEPLCAIWEASARVFVDRELESGRGSLRKLAREQHAAIARLPEPEQLRNVNTPGERSALQKELTESTKASSPGARHGA